MPNSAVLLPSGETHDYAPFGQVADPSSLDAAIMALTPWAYWKLADTSGNYADSSGNGRNAVSVIDPGISLRGQAPMTSKAGPCAILANGAIGLPIVQVHFSSWSGVYTYMGLCSFDALPAAGSPNPGAVGGRYAGSIFLSQASDGVADCDLRIGAQDIVDGASLTLASSQSGTVSQMSGVQGIFSIGKPFVIAVVGASLPGLTWMWDIWINGVKVVSAYPRANHTTTAPTYFILGRLGNTMRLAQVRVSNWAAWNSQLTNKQIMDLTECYFTKADYVANGWMPRTFP